MHGFNGCKLKAERMSLSDGCAGNCVLIGQLLRLVPNPITDMWMTGVSPEI